MPAKKDFVTFGVDTTNFKQLLEAQARLDRYLQALLADKPLPQPHSGDKVTRKEMQAFAVAIGMSRTVASRAFNLGVHGHEQALRNTGASSNAYWDFREAAKADDYPIPIAFFHEAPDYGRTDKARRLLIAYLQAYKHELPDWLKSV